MDFLTFVVEILKIVFSAPFLFAAIVIYLYVKKGNWLLNVLNDIADAIRKVVRQGGKVELRLTGLVIELHEGMIESLPPKESIAEEVPPKNA